MPVPAIDADKRGDAYKKVKPVDGIDEQGLVPDPQVMHVLFARLMAILGPLGILPIIFAVNSVTTAVNFAAASMGAREDFEPAPAGLDSITANQRNQMHNMYDHPDFPNTQARNWRRLASIAAGLPDYMMLATDILHGLLGHNGSLYRLVARQPKIAFLQMCAGLGRHTIEPASHAW